MANVCLAAHILLLLRPEFVGISNENPVSTASTELIEMDIHEYSSTLSLSVLFGYVFIN